MTATPLLPPLEPARIRWDGQQPYAEAYADIYHAADGVAEVQRVFVQPNHLPERFRQLAPGSCITIGETGFGSALNFAVVTELFLRLAPADCRLHFISTEKHPFSGDDMRDCASRRSRAFPELAEIYQALAAVYPALIPGWHRRHLSAGRIQLSLYFGDARQGLTQVAPDQSGGQRCPVDAWLLDGFAPDRNPALWSAALYRALAALSAPGTRIATFTAAGHVRRGLEAVGFAMQRVDQRPFKRHSSAGEFRAAPHPASSRGRPDQVVIAGAGLSGSATARQLALRGIPVTLFDAAAGPANALPATALHPRLTGQQHPLNRLRLAAFDFARHWHDAVQPTPASGALQLASPALSEAQLNSIIEAHSHELPGLIRLDPAPASQLAGNEISVPALHFAAARGVDLGALCTALQQHQRISYRPGRRLHSLSPAAGTWRYGFQTPAETLTGSADARHPLILATGATRDLTEAANYLEVLPVWGQIEILPLAPQPRLPLIGDGFTVPMPDGRTALGATYEYQPWDDARAHQTNLKRLQDYWHTAAGLTLGSGPRDRARGQRAVTSDRLPILGELSNESGEALPGLHLNLGHGSSGLTLVPWMAESLASRLCGELVPMLAEQWGMVSGLRFRERQAKRGFKHGARR